jgi:glycosyltransferase involved in cell wall biosynthesis
VQLNYLHRTDNYQIIWFHDSFEAIAAVLGELDRRTYLIYSFSWYKQIQPLARIFETIRQAVKQLPTCHVDLYRIMFLMNSSTELNTARQLVRVLGLPFSVSFVNEACFRNPEIYHIDHSVEKKYLAVCNSKTALYKRHWLSAKVKNKIFITYATDMERKIDLEQFEPVEIFKNVPPDVVVRLLNRCKIGLILSEEEGSCLASMEYLLCGLPVVSTESRGGRSEFYTPENSIIVPPDANEVFAATQLMLRRLENREADPTAIRAGAIRRAQEFQRTFLNDLSVLLASESDTEAVVGRLSHRLHTDLRNQYFRPI